MRGMIRMNPIYSLAVLFLVFLPLGEAFALYSQPAAAVSGGSSESTNYSNLGVIAQAAIVDSSASTGYGADHGFLPVLGGWRILYPVISADPDTLSFTLLPNSSGSQSVTVANNGGSVLKWNVAKGNPAETYFTVSPASGTGDASISVTANTAGLTPGNYYYDTLTISGNGISRTAQVQLTLLVSSTGTQLSITVVSDTAGKGGGSVHSDPIGISCSNTGSDPAGMTGYCSAAFVPGITVTLYQSPDSNSTHASWTGPCTPSGNDCTVTMDGAKDVTATFPYAHMAKDNSSGLLYDTMAEALLHAAATDTILARDVTFGEDMTIVGKIITLSGGLSPWYLPQNAWTTLSGKLTVQSGQLTVDRLVVK